MSYFWTNLSKKCIIWGYPYNISFEPTNYCNLDCPECPAAKSKQFRSRGHSDITIYKTLINEMHPYLVSMLLYFQGEPFLNPDLWDMISYASRHKIHTITATNGHFLTRKNAQKTVQSGLEEIIISMDGTTQAVYEQYRKEGNLNTVISGMHNLIQAKKKLKSNTPLITLQFLIFRFNEEQIEDMKKFAKEIGVNKLSFKRAQITDFSHAPELLPNNPKNTRYQFAGNGNYTLKAHLANKCPRLWNSSVITQKGDVIPCCFDKYAQHTFGNIKTENFKKIWKNKPYNTFRKNILQNRRGIEMCRNCTSGAKVFVRKE